MAAKQILHLGGPASSYGCLEGMCIELDHAGGEGGANATCPGTACANKGLAASEWIIMAAHFVRCVSTQSPRDLQIVDGDCRGGTRCAKIGAVQQASSSLCGNLAFLSPAPRCYAQNRCAVDADAGSGGLARRPQGNAAKSKPPTARWLLTALVDTHIKKSELHSSLLPPALARPIKAGTVLMLAMPPVDLDDEGYAVIDCDDC